MPEYAEMMLVESCENFRNAEREAWGNLREDLRGVMDSGTDAMAELSADVSNSCMDLMDILA